MCDYDQSNTVSMVIVNYNAGDLLLKAVESALAQVDEVIIIDNASSDNSLILLNKYIYNESNVRIVRNKKNVGFSVACNMGAKISKAPYILFLNPDCILDDGAVNTLKQVLISKKDIGLVGGLLQNPDGTEQAGGRRAIPTPWRSFVRAFGLYRFYSRWPKLFFDFHLHKQTLPDVPVEVEAISGACMLFKREAFDDVGMWDENYFLHCEDLDICMRLRQNEWKIVFVPKAKIDHFIGKCSESCPVFVEWHKHKGMIYFYHKFFKHQYPGILMQMVIAGVWLHFLGAGGSKAIKSKLNNALSKSHRTHV